VTGPRVFGIAGWKNSGKTGLAVRLVEEFTRRGYRISTIKHAHHDFDIDKVGADSYRHRQAGAHEVALVSVTRFAIMHELRGEPEPAFEEILARLGPCDLVLIEGYKREPVPKIEARRLEAKNREPLAEATGFTSGVMRRMVTRRLSCSAASVRIFRKRSP